MGNGQLGPGESLQPGQSVFSPDGSVEFRFQDDGKAAIYHGSNCVWQNTEQQRYDVVECVMADGQLALKDRDGRVVWHSDNPNHDYNSLAVQDDGNVVIYQPVWSTSTNK